MDFGFDDTTSSCSSGCSSSWTSACTPRRRASARRSTSADDPWGTPPVLEELKAEARRRGLWNLFLPRTHEFGAGLTNLQYAPLAEITGRNPWIAPEAINCSAPDTGNMELLSLFGTEEQQRAVARAAARRRRSARRSR